MIRKDRLFLSSTESWVTAPCGVRVWVGSLLGSRGGGRVSNKRVRCFVDFIMESDTSKKNKFILTNKRLIQ